MTRKPRPFGPDLRDASIPPDAREAIGVRPWQGQQNVLAYAPTKADAVDALAAAGLTTASQNLRVQMGDDVDALVKSGALEPGGVYLWSADGGDRPVVRVAAPGVYERVGTFHAGPRGTFTPDVTPKDTAEYDVEYDVEDNTFMSTETGAAATGKCVADLLADPTVTRVEVTRR